MHFGVMKSNTLFKQCQCTKMSIKHFTYWETILSTHWVFYMATSPTLDFLGINVVKDMGFNVIGYTTTKCGCNPLVRVH
jgi:hypothetical protein